EFIRFDDSRMDQLHRDLAFGRLLEPLEASFERGALFRIENLQAHDLAGLAIFAHEKIRHRAADRFAQQLEPVRHIDAAVFEHAREFFEKAESHIQAGGSGTDAPALVVAQQTTVLSRGLIDHNQKRNRGSSARASKLNSKSSRLMRQGTGGQMGYRG